MSDSSTSGVQPLPASVTVIVPVRNGAHTIGTQLDALQEQSYAGQFDILVSDNGSTDELVEVLGRRPGYGRVHVGYVLADEVPGVSHARNVGARHATGEFLVFCDADDVVREDWLHHMVVAARHADLVSGSLDTSVINAPAEHARRPFLPTVGLFETRFLPFAPGCNFGVWADVIEAVGGFDTSMVFGGEDVDFSWRTYIGGWKMAHAELAVVDYRMRSTLSSFFTQLRRYAVGNVELYVGFRDYGFRRSSALSVLRFLFLILVSNPLLPRRISGRTRGEWVGYVAILIGHLQGSIRYRTFFL